MFDNLSNAEVVDVILQTIEFHRPKFDSSLISAEDVFTECVNNVIRKAMAANSEDNLTCILVFFRNPLM